MPSLTDEDLIDAYHDGYFARGGIPYASGPLADAWKDGKRDAGRDRRRVVTIPARPEGYYHSRPEAA